MKIIFAAALLALLITDSFVLQFALLAAMLAAGYIIAREK